ncbi:nonstructural protein [Sigmofec virus UA08Rod_6251]|uniref:Nonstructural protein n=1 Tax=Sigmofec virus UA08Rod_6251 TaxID=2929226 RepID=A0A976R780_9VIRU|nr:nonstructural protein [Sigmofec virus UA08Rod_6251]
MITNLYSILDVKSGIYGPVISFHNDMTAIRSFTEMLIKPDGQSLLSLYPSDYILCCIGHFNQEAGVIDSIPAPLHVITGMEAMTRAADETKRRELLRKAIETGDSDSLSQISSDEFESSNQTISNSTILK